MSRTTPAALVWAFVLIWFGELVAFMMSVVSRRS